MTDEPPERERLKAIAVPLFVAAGLAEGLQGISLDFLESTLNPAINRDPSPVPEAHGITTPLSVNQGWHSKIVEVGSTLGVSGHRSPDEILEDLKVILNITGSPSEKGDTVAAVAERLGLGDSRRNSRISLLESIGAKLGVQREYFFDQNQYYAEAEKCWTEGIAQKLGIALTRSDKEILLRVGEKLGVSFAPEEVEESAILQRIASRLGVSSMGDKMATLSNVESAIRARGSTGRR